MLLWNLTPEPKYEVYQAIEEVYQAHGLSFIQYQGVEVQSEIVREFGQEILDSGYFKRVIMEQTACEVTYDIEDYLKLLSTFGRLEPQVKDLLFSELRETLEQFGETVPLSFISAIHLACKHGEPHE